MRVFLCEKPSQGKDIARVLGATGRGEGYIQGQLVGDQPSPGPGISRDARLFLEDAANSITGHFTMVVALLNEATELLIADTIGLITTLNH